MFEIIENVYFTACCLRSYYLVGLRHLSCPIDLTLVVYLYFYLNPFLFLSVVGLSHHIGRSSWTLIIESCIELSRVFGGLEWYFCLDNLDVVLLVIRRVSSYE
jgi:hypothetical protein